ncbi:response regulator transcription factor [Campylobacter ureolyticus]|uniref:Alkaline phosphatase synthesis transcriptional regulatory protein PhoP n=1 Tax=Campylobacter ureolyticus TaxID=827 RepID=A0A6N2R6F0_9BACT|nr:response regulator transcription factor [Campylobacter ureolyticus]MCZ6150683.1 response regulator transcription factor [Campylobacter ureolyticus]MCZ6155972.1 response regulator transcription factor [Campylobacter ureolyticus]MCZ6158937.1 response regulator transcription factor [Campylobacter ureolyticus]MCZ6162984.1 response regulator transcription factor [Campylobacter ureolyticus]MCZ6164523.1 response regulator transcription factor [Campylobacter ureolyticus]
MESLIVVIDDEEDMLDLLEYNLTKAGYEVLGFLNTSKIEQLLNEENVDLLIVDRNLPGIEGSEFIKNLRLKGYNNSVIFLSAKTSMNEQLEGFEAGGDDYITKPFEMDNLLARIKAVLKRTKKKADIYKFKDIFINLTNAEVLIGNTNVELTKLETNLLVEFIKNKNILLTRDYLLSAIWNDENSSEKTVNIAIKRLREKIDPTKEKKYIKSIRGEGYMLC